MTEIEFEEVLRRAQEIQTFHFTSKEASKMNQLAMNFGDGSYNELTLTEAAYVLNVASMDMSGDYSELGLTIVKDYYLKNITLKEDEEATIREISDNIFIYESDYIYLNDTSNHIFSKGESIAILKNYALEKLSKEVLDLAIDVEDRFTWTNEDITLLMYEIPIDFKVDYPEIATDLSERWDFLLDKFNLTGSEIIDQFIKNLGVDNETNEDFYFYKRSFIKKVMINFLDKLSSDEEWVLMLNKVLLEEDDEGFNNLMKEVKIIGFSRYEFIYWWTFHRPGTFSGIDTACLNKVDTVLEELVSLARFETINSFLSGDRGTFDDIKQEFTILSKQDLFDHEINYEDFEEHYMDAHYALRYLLSLNGVRFVDEDDEDETLEIYLL